MSCCSSHTCLQMLVTQFRGGRLFCFRGKGNHLGQRTKGMMFATREREVKNNNSVNPILQDYQNPKL